MFERIKTITLRDADAGGVLFFARYLALAHDVYEEFMTSQGIHFRDMIEGGELLIPVIHTESSYRAPLFVGDHVTIRLEVAEIKKRTFTIVYEFHRADGVLAATCRTVHATVNRRVRHAIPLPEDVLAALRAALRATCEDKGET